SPVVAGNDRVSPLLMTLPEGAFTAPHQRKFPAVEASMTAKATIVPQSAVACGNVMMFALTFVAVAPEAFAQFATLFVTATLAYPAVPIVSSVPPPLSDGLAV